LDPYSFVNVLLFGCNPFLRPNKLGIEFGLLDHKLFVMNLLPAILASQSHQWLLAAV
jgi:hypothetical protein